MPFHKPDPETAALIAALHKLGQEAIGRAAVLETQPELPRIGLALRVRRAFYAYAVADERRSEVISARGAAEAEPTIVMTEEEFNEHGLDQG